MAWFTSVFGDEIMKWIVVFFVRGCFGCAGVDRPNILFIYGDDIGYGDFSCYGGEVNTYHIDQLGSSGRSFYEWILFFSDMHTFSLFIVNGGV